MHDHSQVSLLLSLSPSWASGSLRASTTKIPYVRRHCGPNTGFDGSPANPITLELSLARQLSRLNMLTTLFRHYTSSHYRLHDLYTPHLQYELEYSIVMFV